MFPIIGSTCGNSIADGNWVWRKCPECRGTGTIPATKDEMLALAAVDAMGSERPESQGMFEYYRQWKKAGERVSCPDCAGAGGIRKWAR